MFREITWDTVDWMGLSQDWDTWLALSNTIMIVQITFNGGSF